MAALVAIALERAVWVSSVPAVGGEGPMRSHVIAEAMPATWREQDEQKERSRLERSEEGRRVGGG